MKEHWTVTYERIRRVLQRNGAELHDDQGYIVAKWWGDGRAPAAELIFNQQCELEEADIDRPSTRQVPEFARVMARVHAALTEIEAIRKANEAA